MLPLGFTLGGRHSVALQCGTRWALLTDCTIPRTAVVQHLVVTRLLCTNLRLAGCITYS